MMESRIFMLLITVAISVISYLLKRQVATNDELRGQIDQLNVRVAINENEVGNTHRMLASIEDNLKYLVRRVDDIAKGN